MSASTALDATASVAARSFCRSFNILLKYVRLYGSTHNLTAEALGQTAQLESAMQNPEKLLQLIVAAEGMGKAAKASSLAALVECVRSLRTEGAGAGDGSGAGAGAGTGQQDGAAQGVEVKDLVNEISEELKRHKGKPSMADLVRIAEHAAIRLAMERFKRGDVKVDAVQRMMEKMGKQIDALRKMLFEHEKNMERAGLTVESHASILDRQFWAELPEKAKFDVLLSADAHCIPTRNIRSFVQQLNERGDQKTSIAILRNYLSLLPSPDAEAVRKTSTGLAELADVLAKA